MIGCDISYPIQREPWSSQKEASLVLYTKQENQIKVPILIGLYRGLLTIAFIQIPLLYECAFFFNMRW